jgi:hypothetical protein
MPRDDCVLDLKIEWRDLNSYYLSGRFLDSKSDQDNDLFDAVALDIDPDCLGLLAHDTAAYGAKLTEMTFSDPNGEALRAYDKARAAAREREGLRVRLNIRPSANELHALRWETLLDPRDGGRKLLTQGNLWFSRFLSTGEIELKPVSDTRLLQALIVVANPSDTRTWGLEPIDLEAEVGRATTALSAEGGTAGLAIRTRRLEKAASVYNLITELRDKYVDILYLVCHGALVHNEARLLLEKDDRTGQAILGQEIVERLRDMTEKPRLVVLASCESAGPESGVALAAIGPRIAQAGVPSVVAMQGRISQTSAGRFMRHLLGALVEDGQIDRAVAVARSNIADQPDWWMPVLFLGTRTGRLWPATAGDAGTFDKWDALVSAISEGRCVPVLGPGLVTSVMGSRREIAQRWAERYEFALAPRDRDDLSQVAQYLTYRQSKQLAVNELRLWFVSRIRREFKAALETIDEHDGTTLLTCPVEIGLLNKLIRKLGEWQRGQNNNDPHRLLAKLPVSVFISANRDSLLSDALRAEGKMPEVQLCTWRVRNDAPVRFGPPMPKDYEPSIERPLVFQVFGNLEYPESLVLTEDDYFDFLIAVTRNESLEKAAVPGAVSNALAASGLLLVGFQADDWDFRTLFRGIMKQPGSALGDDCARVAVQLSPEEGPMIDPDRASKYLYSYFQRNRNTSVFWGSPEQFMTSLFQRCARLGLVRLD